MEQLVYEDSLIRADLPANGAAVGHILVQMQRKVNRLSGLSLEESAHLFRVASYAAAILFQGLKAEGTNIVVDEKEGLKVHVIARRSDDGLSFAWEPKELTESDMEDVADRIREKTFLLNHPDGRATEKPSRSPSAPDEETLQEEERENYLIKQLVRVP